MMEPVTKADAPAAMKTVALRLETDLDAPIDKVWRALTDPAILAKWLLTTTFSAEDGRFRLDVGDRLGGAINCTLVESDPPRRLAWCWRLPAESDQPAADTLVRFNLDALPDGRTRLKLVHDEFRVPATYPADRLAEADVVVLLPPAALRPRRIRRPRPMARLRSGPAPTLMMRLAA